MTLTSPSESFVSTTGRLPDTWTPPTPKTLEEVEVLFTTFFLKSLENTTENGLLPLRQSGYGHFSDLFLQEVARSMVKSYPLGFEQALAHTYGASLDSPASPKTKDTRPLAR
jgi:hypothetical protein